VLISADKADVFRVVLAEFPRSLDPAFYASKQFLEKDVDNDYEYNVT